jgi:crotonobetainyl-CoA:carnitine CoA-transferase CaiB-like acyl-CoA transferase
VSTSPQALGDLRVVEFGAFAAGPAVGKHLGDHGAEVVHVESRQRPDGFRFNYPPFKGTKPGPDRAAMYAITNDNKFGVTLNLKSPGGVELALRLARRADVVIENFTPGTMARLGLGPERLRRENARLVVLSTCNQGQAGPLAKQPGFGTHLTSLSGLTHLTGWPDRAPALLWGPYIDYIAVAYGVVAVLAALEHRRQTGLGCHVDLSQLEAGIQFMAPVMLDYFATGRVAQRTGNRDPVACPHGVYACRGRQRWCAISVHDDPQWLAMRVAMGDPVWARDRSLAGLQGRRAAEEELDRRLTEWTRSRAREEVVSRLRAGGVPCAPVNDMADLHRDAQLAERQVWRRVEHPVIGPYSAVGPPFLLSETPARIRSAAPLLGEHNQHVFRDLLELTADEYDRHLAEGTFD